MNTFSKLDALKTRLAQYRPLDPHILNNLHENLVLRWTYHSNAIEGNTLTLKETKVALEGITVGGKTLREHFEAINHRDAILLMEELVSRQQPLDEWTIKSLHQLILKNIDSDNAGRYRQINVLISGADHRPPEALTVPEQMTRKPCTRLNGPPEYTASLSKSILLWTAMAAPRAC
jgi:Fic family protein